MKRANVPFNIRILQLTPDKLKMIKPVTSLDIFDQTKVNFHEEGLYSISIFGRVGDPLRSKRFSYINIKLPVFHPIIWRAIHRLKSLYTEIMEGTSYAVWDSDAKDFVKSTPVDGETGYAFFLRYWDRIQFATNESVTRQEAIALIKKYKDNAMTSRIVVMPAGLREVEYQGTRVVEDEINDFYRRFLSISNTITENAVKHSPELLDRPRLSSQRAFNELYEYIEKMLEGKKKFILGKWASRKVFNSTRNVLTSMPTTITRLGDKNNADINTTTLGMFQAMRANLPITKYHLRTGFLSKVFQGPGTPVRLVNKKTLKVEELNIDSKYYDTFMTDEGLDKLVAAFADDNLRHQPVEIEGRYLGLVYKGPDATFKFLSDITELPAGRELKDCSPITLAELIYGSIYPTINKAKIFVTRYPITGMGSIYPSNMDVFTTVKSESRTELNDDWTPGSEEMIAPKFPIRSEAWFNTLSPNYMLISGLGADFDGDTGSGTTVYSKEGIEEIDKFFLSKQAYVDTNNKLYNTAAVELNSLVFWNMTRQQPA